MSGELRQYKVEMTLMAEADVESADIRSDLEAAMLMRGYDISEDAILVTEETP